MKQILLFLSFSLLALMLPQEMFAQPANDECAAATPLAVGTGFCDGVATNGDNTAATAGTDPVGSCFSGGSNGVWFSFVAPASGEISVTTDFAGGTNTDTEVAVFDDCVGTTELGCDQDGGTAVNFNSVIPSIAGLTPGTTYFINVSGWNGTEGTFCLEVEEILPPTCTAPTVTVAVNNTGCPAAAAADFDVTDLGTATELTFSDDQGTAPVTVTATGPLNFGSYPSGTVVTFTVTYGAMADPTCDLTGSFTIACPPANDECADATPLAVGVGFCDGVATNGDNTGATAGTDPVGSCFSGGSNGVWFSFVAPASGDVAVTTDFAGGTNTDTEVAVFDDCAGTTELGCDQDGGTVVTFNSVIPSVAGLTPGTTYYINVSGWNGNIGTFCLEVSENSCTDPTFTATLNAAGCPAAASIDFDITDLGTATELTISDDQGTAPVTVTATGPVTFGSYADGTVVNYTVAHSAPANATCDVTGSVTVVCPPANDECANAIPLALGTGTCDGVMTNGDNTGATAGTDPVGSCFSGGSNGVWFSFVAPASGAVMATTDFAGGTNTDTEVAIFDDCAGTNELGCDQDGGTVVTFNSIITEAGGLIAGNTYYVNVSGWNGAEGSFCLEITEIPCPTEVTFVNTSNIPLVVYSVAAADGFETYTGTQIAPGGVGSVPAVTGEVHKLRTELQFVDVMDFTTDVCGETVTIDPCGGDMTDADGDGFCDAAMSCTYETGGIKSYGAADGALGLDYFRTTMRGFGNIDASTSLNDELLSDNIANIIGVTGNQVALVDPVNGNIVTFVLNTGLQVQNYTATALTGGEYDGMTWAALLGSIHGIHGIHGIHVSLTGADGSIIKYNAETGAMIADYARTTFTDGPLMGTDISAATIVGAHVNWFTVLLADGTLATYANSSTTVLTDYAGTALTGGVFDGSSFSDEETSIIGYTPGSAYLLSTCVPAGTPPPAVQGNEPSGSYISTTKTNTNNSALNVFPNPTYADINIQISGANDKLVSGVIMDNLGRQVYEIKPFVSNGELLTITSDNFAGGIYFVNVQVGQETLVKRFIVRK